MIAPIVPNIAPKDKLQCEWVCLFVPVRVSRPVASLVRLRKQRRRLSGETRTMTQRTMTAARPSARTCQPTLGQATDLDVQQLQAIGMEKRCERAVHMHIVKFSGESLHCPCTMHTINNEGSSNNMLI